MKASKAYLEKNEISTQHPDFVSLASMLKNNTGYMYAFTLFRFEQQINTTILGVLFRDLQDNRNLLSNLPKPVANYRSYVELRRDLEEVSRVSAVTKFVQQCPSSLKQIMRDHKSEWGNITSSAASFDKLTSDQKKLFTKSIMRYKSYKHITEALTRFVEYVRSGKDFTTRIAQSARTKRAHLRVIDAENNIVIVRCATRASIVALGKGTSWCISDPRETYWSNYVRNADDQQYVLYDFNFPLTHKKHIIGVTNQDGRITSAHANGNDAIDMNEHIRNTPYLKQEFFKVGDGESKTEDLLDRKGNSLTTEDIAQITQWGHLDKALFGLKMNANKAAKTFGPLLRDVGDTMTSESVARALVLIYKIVDSTKFFNEFIPSLHHLDMGSLNYLKKLGLNLKYGVHLEQILDTYYKHSEIVTRTQIKEINGIKYRETITLEPLTSMPLEILELLISTNSEVVTNKALKMAKDFKNLDVFKLLMDNFKGKVQKMNDYPSEYREYINSKV